ncbi:DUF6517 family protein [Natronolimnohabitans innermongolicus]|uniref:Uncharacterized protein n=1 Tax=Natronolimnohabitans innermongolicus JCM 12255 TaxID=1227499 RepID=L9XE45_9EURY|nr:DUF6517 family protein [Natronolimnohabitans innermongolicus]ELY59984.1 hypothetical protein C493_04413 [Natronolimnohabitans innermongolicus JCM 12255]
MCIRDRIGVAGQNFNPVEDKSSAELVELVENNYDDISDITHEDDDEIEILGETTTRSRFSADATFDGHDLEVDLHVSEAVEAGDDLLVTIGVYPQDPEFVRGREEENVLALMEGVTTDIDHDETADDGNGDENGADGGDGDDETGGDDENESDDEDGDADGDDGVLGVLE